MKVETDLKSGSFVQDTAQQVSQVAGQVATLFTNANQQAADLTQGMINKSTALWKALVS
jgi:hypothetical protein